MAMTSTDYQLIAGSFEQQLSEIHLTEDKTGATQRTIEACADRLAKRFESTQPNFHKAKFMQAAIGRDSL